MDKPPLESGFDDPEVRQRFQKIQEDEDEDFSPTIAPWPLAFTIFGLGLIGAVVYQIVSYVLR